MSKRTPRRRAADREGDSLIEEMVGVFRGYAEEVRETHAALVEHAKVEESDIADIKRDVSARFTIVERSMVDMSQTLGEMNKDLHYMRGAFQAFFNSDTNDQISQKRHGLIALLERTGSFSRAWHTVLMRIVEVVAIALIVYIAVSVRDRTIYDIQHAAPYAAPPAQGQAK